VEDGTGDVLETVAVLVGGGFAVEVEVVATLFTPVSAGVDELEDEDTVDEPGGVLLLLTFPSTLCEIRGERESMDTYRSSSPTRTPRQPPCQIHSGIAAKRRF